MHFHACMLEPDFALLPQRVFRRIYCELFSLILFYIYCETEYLRAFCFVTYVLENPLATVVVRYESSRVSVVPQGATWSKTEGGQQTLENFFAMLEIYTTFDVPTQVVLFCSVLFCSTRPPHRFSAPLCLEKFVNFDIPAQVVQSPAVPSPSVAMWRIHIAQIVQIAAAPYPSEKSTVFIITRMTFTTALMCIGA